MDVLAVIAAGVSLLCVLLVFTVAARRLLGLPFSWPRSILAGLLACLVVGPISRAMASAVPSSTGDGITPIWFLILGAACALLAAMIFLVVAEALVPTGSLPRLRDIAPELGGRLSRARRYSRISGIALRHGLSPYLRGRRAAQMDAPGTRARLARSLRLALDDGGVTFVKLGQLLSTRRDLLPAEFVEELGHLQDRVAPAAWDEIEPVLAAELGRPPDEIFAELDRTPLAAASIAQVYAARLSSGEEVVVKVQRPGIRPVVERDLDILARLAGTAERNTRWGRALGARELAAGFAESIREELDFRVEAGNMTAVAAAHGVGDRVRLPAPCPSLCTARVLVMERLDGVPLSSAGPVIEELELDRSALAGDALDCLLRQIVLDGVFHADPHPGNIFLLADGRLGLLDFGSVGRLDPSLRGALQHLLMAIDRGDVPAVSDALLEVVMGADEVDEARLERALGQFMVRHLGPGSTPGVRLFADLFRIVSAHGLSIPPEVAAAFRALGTLEGTLVQLCPGFNLVVEARAFANAYLAERMTAASLRRTMEEELTALLPTLRRMPRRIERIAGAVESGRLSANVRLFADARDRRVATGMLQQVLLTFLAATAGIMAVLLLGNPGGPRVTSTVSLYQLLGYNLLVVCAVLALRVLVLIFRRDD